MEDKDTQRWRWIWAKGVMTGFGLFGPDPGLKFGFGSGNEEWA